MGNLSYLRQSAELAGGYSDVKQRNSLDYNKIFGIHQLRNYN